MNIESVPFKAEHMIEISEHIIEKTYTPEEWRQWAWYNEQKSVGLTIKLNGKVMACLGIEISKSRLWSVIHEEVKNYKRELIIGGVKCIKELMEAAKTDKLTAIIKHGNTEGRTLLKHLGFIPLGTETEEGYEDYERAA